MAISEVFLLIVRAVACGETNSKKWFEMVVYGVFVYEKN
jgi:hypothetical protein